MALSKRDAVLALLAAGALPPLAYAVAQPRGPAPKRAGADYMSRELRAQVERLKQAIAATPTNDRNIGERVLVLYDWANAYA
jgi:hypothetical protein